MNKPALSNNRIPTGMIWAFGILFLVSLFALPFVLFKIMSATQNQSQGMTLAAAANLPMEARTLRPSVRQSEDKSSSAGRYELPSLEVAKVAYAMSPVEKPSPAFIAELLELAPKETRWQPVATGKGPWYESSGVANGLAWHALLDEGASVLWIRGEQAVLAAPATTPAK